MKFKIGIIGGSGYVAGELIRTLLHHPAVEIKSVVSSNFSGEKVSKIHQDLIGQTDLVFEEKLAPILDVVFLCLGHGLSINLLNSINIPPFTKIIDLSNDFRLKHNQIVGKRTFTYGLTELYKEEIVKSKNVANPGCFATAIQLAILPLAKSQLLKKDIHVHAITGSTGAGQEKTETSHFSWRNNNVSAYKAFEHQHLGEINENISFLQPTFKKELHFVPIRGNFTRGIMASIYTEIEADIKEVEKIYQSFYESSSFVKVTTQDVHLKQVVGTNNVVIQIAKHGKQLHIVSCIDNLLKGAAGQAIENMNLMLGIPQNLSLELKGNYF